MSLNGAIIGMAQNFVSSNNINLLAPSGQFGTCRLGGKDVALPRYIFTKLEKITRTIFHPDDNGLIDGHDMKKLNPCYYVFNGPITAETGTRVGFYTANGIIERTDNTLSSSKKKLNLPFEFGM